MKLSIQRPSPPNKGRRAGPVDRARAANRSGYRGTFTGCHVMRPVGLFGLGRDLAVRSAAAPVTERQPVRLSPRIVEAHPAMVTALG